jgi:hypothetical protein
MTSENRSLRFPRTMIAVFIIGVVLSGLTAMPLQTQLDVGVRFVDRSSDVGHWVWRVRDDVERINRESPFIFYGFDWLAFGHIAIAILFIPAWRDPIRNRWLLDYGLLLCGLVIVWALCCAPFRGIPWGWVALDCSFGVFGAVPLYLARRSIKRIMKRDA